MKLTRFPKKNISAILTIAIRDSWIQPRSPFVRAICKRSEKEDRRRERILRIPSGISGGALSRPDSFGGASSAIDNNKDGTIVMTRMRIVYRPISHERPPCAPRRGGCDLRARRERDINSDHILIALYLMPRLRECGPGDREKYTLAASGKGQRESRMYRISPRVRRSGGCAREESRTEMYTECKP